MELKQNLGLQLCNVHDMEYHVKVLVIGDPLIGKTNFITSFVDYNTPYETLIGYNKSSQVNYLSKMLSNLNSRPGDKFKFHIWEISDYDENRDLIRTYIKNTQIVMLCFSLKNPDSFDSLKYWLYEKNNNVKYILIGLKSSFNNKINNNDILEFYKYHKLEYYEFKDSNNNTIHNIHLPFTKFLNDIYPKIDVVIERQNTSIINNIISYCSIL
jgi:GTPase SAR1 family protein